MQVLPPEATVEDANISMLVGVDGMTPTTVWTKLAHRLDVFITEV
jgi:signal recognition particle GTPase